MKDTARVLESSHGGVCIFVFFCVLPGRLSFSGNEPPVVLTIFFTTTFVLGLRVLWRTKRVGRIARANGCEAMFRMRF